MARQPEGWQLGATRDPMTFNSRAAAEHFVERCGEGTVFALVARPVEDGGES